MRTTRVLITGLAAAIAFGACGNDDTTPRTDPPTTVPSSSLDLDGRTFLSTEVTENGAPKTLVAGSRIRLSFLDGAISVQAGCNTGGGDYRIVDGALITEAMAMTEMACEEPLMAQDEWMLDFLGDHPAIKLDGDTLTLTTDTTEIEMLDREVADPDRPLVGTEWLGTTIIDGGAASSVAEGAVVRLEFGNDGRVAGKTGCNQGSANYSVDGSTITFGPFMLTKMACEQGPASVEAHVLSVLTGETEFDIEAGSLTIMNGEIGLGFSALPLPD